MVISLSRKSARTLSALLFIGAAAGFLNGLLGAGGGIVLVWALGALNADRSAAGVRDNFAATIACVIPMTALSALLYAADGRLSAEAVLPLLLPAAAGGILGALLLDKISTKLLKKIFALLVVFAGISMLVR